jgi:hypothetical protein
MYAFQGEDFAVATAEATAEATVKVDCDAEVSMSG